MRRSEGARWWMALVAIASALAGTPVTLRADEEPATSPYSIRYGARDLAERTTLHRTLAAAAAARGDLPDQARHAGMACVWHTLIAPDWRMASPSCEQARRLARTTGLVDVQLTLDGLRAELTLRALEPAAAEPMLAGVIARGAGLDPATAEARPVRRARTGRAVALTELARYDEATDEFERARQESRRAGDLDEVANADVWDCWNQQIQGEMARAHEACERARAHLARSEDFYLDLDVTYVGGLLRDAEGDFEGALSDFERAVWLSARPGGAMREPIARSVVAATFIELDRLDEARAHLEAIDRDIAAGRFFPGLVPLVEHQWAKLERAAGRPSQAMRHFAASSRSPEHFISIFGVRGLAWARRQLGDLAGARAALEEAIHRVEAERVSVASAAARASIAEIHAAVYRDLVSVRWDAEGEAAAAAALEIAEAGRARALLDALASAEVTGAAAPTLSAAAVQATLGPEDVLVEYVSAEDRLLAITVTRDRIAFTALPLAGTATELGRRVDFFSALVQQADEAALVPAARRLHADLLAPVLESVGPEVRTLIIAADGPLHRLPFDALGETRRVVDRWDVVRMPSASALANRVRPSAPPAAALVVAAPANPTGFAPLPAAPAEAAAIRRRLGGEIAELDGAGATKERLEAIGLGRFAVLHFASHALVDEARPLRSALVLAPSTPGADGRWSADEIYRTSLGADLVVLSACGTAAGAQTSGEGVMSLARAFLWAGAGATVATLWDVPDAAGPVFTDILYRELGSGRRIGAAVADARRELRRLGAPPRVWAAYALTGRPAASVGVIARVDQGAVASQIAFGLAVALLLAGAAMRRAHVRWRIPWSAAVLAGAGVAGVALVLQTRPARIPAWDAGMLPDRGSIESAFAITVEGGRLGWSPVEGADEHVVDMYDTAGVPVGAPVAATSPFVPPVSAAGGWVRIEARRHHQPLARSPLIGFPGAP